MKFDYQRPPPEITPALREYVTTRLVRIKRHFDQVIDVKVLPQSKNKEKRASPSVQSARFMSKGRTCFAESAHEDLYAAIDDLMDKLDRQVVSPKDRRQDHHHLGEQAYGLAWCATRRGRCIISPDHEPPRRHLAAAPSRCGRRSHQQKACFLKKWACCLKSSMV